MAFPKLSLAASIWLSGAAIVVTLVSWFAWPRPVAVLVSTVDRGEIERGIVEEGRARVEDVYVVASPVGGVLRRIQLEPGDSVSRDDALALIVPADPNLLDARIAAESVATIAGARATLAIAEADLELARRDEARTMQLFKRGYVAQAALDHAQGKRNVATLAVIQRKAELNRALASQGGPAANAGAISKVRSPTSGKVLRILQESETVLSAGTPLLEIGDPARIEIVAEFLSQDAAAMHVGAPALIENWGGGRPLAATVHAIEPYARTKISALGVEEQRVNVIVHLPDSRPEAIAKLGHGFRADVRIIVFHEDDSLRVPTDALVRQGNGNWGVFRVVDGRARLISVDVGDGDDRFRKLIKGLSAGNQVVLFPGDTLRDGDFVDIRSR